MIEGSVRGVVIVYTSVGGEHTLVVDLKGAGVGVLVVAGRALLDTHKHRYRAWIVPRRVGEILTERRAVVIQELHILVSVGLRLNVTESR